MNHNLLEFDMALGRQKPETIVHTDHYCPFCDRENLENIIDSDGSILLVRNKYNVLKGTDQFVLIEGDACHSDMPEYTTEHMRKLIHFGVHHWRQLLHCGKYQEVLFFKNFGPLSGGTIRHPHMQLIALPKLTNAITVHPEEFEGPVIYAQNDVSMTVSDQPRIGFWEFNLIVRKLTDQSLDTLADYLQIATDYLTHHFHKHCNSYNIFFYHRDKTIYAKLMPRFATPPIFVGYSIRVRPTNYETIAEEFHNLYGK
ncbi:MAG: DUF4931 domain-containing protein [Selenomonas sp.]|uniref:DUF4931 domain-containing protein n=1 Tax=Selenomonas sp. TaxID=2053611 RepID=UPI0025D71345|nr:DUF4931 domain-containing protein [Selenomonas sp.]MCR5439482.1 DUF4931 domain-containing protein [Selenomonas sp.]